MIAFCAAHFGWFLFLLIAYLLRCMWVLGEPMYVRDVHGRFDDEFGELSDQLLYRGVVTTILLIPIVLGCLN